MTPGRDIERDMPGGVRAFEVSPQLPDQKLPFVWTPPERPHAWHTIQGGQANVARPAGGGAHAASHLRLVPGAAFGPSVAALSASRMQGRPSYMEYMPQPSLQEAAAAQSQTYSTGVHPSLVGSGVGVDAQRVAAPSHVDNVLPASSREDEGEDVMDVSQVEFGATAETVDRESCVVCLDRVSTHAIIPCGHRCVCDGCKDLVTSCPMCRGNKDSTLRVFT